MPGVILYKGPSQLDGAPILLVATVDSGNMKTGDMVQTWIVRADIAPSLAVKTGADVSVCGDCKARGSYCYVAVHQAPTSVHAAALRGAYLDISADLDDIRAIGAGRAVRIGSYGDPAAVPAAVWHALAADALMHTGYSHQWRNPAAADLRGLVMASADTPEERAAAHAAGWRTFRARLADEPVGPGEFVCPASHEGGQRKTCAECGACDGARDGDRRASPAIIAHGARAKRYIMMRAAA